jgi:molybdenum cofactor guanylyltransferase
MNHERTATSHPLCGLVLAGGRSERMGRDKVALRHPDGRTLGERGRDLLLQAGCGEVFVSLRADQDPPAGWETATILRDPPGGSCGPLAGIVAAMRARLEADWLVLACDLPLLGPATLAALLSARREGEPFLAFRSSSDGLPEPLCALYAREARPVLEAALAADFRCPRKLLIRNHCRLIDPVDVRALDNANTPDDWERMLNS